MRRRISKALMMNTVQPVPYYRSLLWDHPEDLLFFEPQGIDWESERVRGLRLHRGQWLRGYFAVPETVYNRCFPQPDAVVEKFTAFLGTEHIFNERTHLDKWEVHQHLRASEVGEYLPATYTYDEDELTKLVADHGALILKPRLSHGGAGVLKITNVSQNVIIVLTQWGLPIPLWDERLHIPFLTALAPPSSCLAQEYIESLKLGQDKFDVRIVMQKNRLGEWDVGGELSRLTEASNLLTNHYYAIVPPRDLLPGHVLATLHSISRVVADTLDKDLAHLGELGVDFLLDEEGKPWILEVNGKPDKSLFRKLNDARVLRRVYLNPLAYQDHLLSL